MSIKFTLASVLLVTALPLTACTSSKGLEEEHVATTQQRLTGKNGLSSNGLSSNGLSSNGLSATGIDVHGLSLSGLTNNSNVMDHLTEAYSLELLRYITTCALPAGEDNNIPITISGVSPDPPPLEGALALATEWQGDNGRCETDACRSWISSCLLSRVNFLGEHVIIDLRGNDLPSNGLFESAEAVYWGDLFSNPTKRYACRIGGSTLIERVCGPEDPENPGWPGCVVEVMPHDCSEYCTAADGGDGHYVDCVDPHDSSTHYPEPITVYRDMIAPFDPSSSSDGGTDAGTD